MISATPSPNVTPSHCLYLRLLRDRLALLNRFFDRSDHVQRGGRPNAFDRMLATNFGACAVRALAEGKRGVMVALQAGDVVTVPLSEAVANLKTVPPNGQLVRTARDTGISFGSPDEDKFHRKN